MAKVLNNSSDRGPGIRQHRWWREWRNFALFIAIMLIFRSAVADWNHVPSGSMIPSILEGDRIVVDKLAYGLRIPFTLTSIARWGEPQRGDVVTFESPVNDILLVKRVIGIPGDIVAMQDNRLIVNGEPASYRRPDDSEYKWLVEYASPDVDIYRERSHGNERFVMLRKRPSDLPTSFPPVQVPQGQYLMLGDNRDNSQDSRVIGFVDGQRITGRAHSVAFSLDYNNYLVPRADRFFEALP